MKMFSNKLSCQKWAHEIFMMTPQPAWKNQASNRVVPLASRFLALSSDPLVFPPIPSGSLESTRISSCPLVFSQVHLHFLASFVFFPCFPRIFLGTARVSSCLLVFPPIPLVSLAFPPVPSLFPPVLLGSILRIRVRPGSSWRAHHMHRQHGVQIFI